MTKHIEGPWDLAWEDGKHGVVTKVLEGQMAQFVCLIGNNDDDPEKNAIRKANAQLIAAAPELLDALENLMIAVGMGWDTDGCIEVAQAAIAKARGEQ